MDNEVTDEKTEAFEQRAKTGKVRTTRAKTENGDIDGDNDETPNVPKPIEVPERDKTLIANIRKVHSMWDKAARDWRGCLARSATNDNTKGCKFEVDLTANQTTGAEMDAKICDLELKFNKGHIMSDADIDAGTQTSTKLVELIKAGNKKSAEIQRWWKM